MLFKDIEEIRKYVNISAGTNIETISPDITRMESQVLRKYLGKILYDELCTEYDLHQGNISEMEDYLNALLLKARPAVALLSVLNAAGILSVQISDSGFQMLSSETYKQAFAWMKNDAREYLAQFGYVMIDEMLQFLEENKDDYPAWVNDEKAYTLGKRFIVVDALCFNDNININESRLTYAAFKPIMFRVESFDISPQITAALFNAIKAEIASATISEDTQALLNFLQPATACLSASKGLFELPLQITNSGVLMNYSKAFETQQNKETKVADTTDRNTIARQWENDGKKWLQACIDYLNDTASETKYAAFYNSAQYKGNGKRPTPYTNESGDRIFSFS